MESLAWFRNRLSEGKFCVVLHDSLLSLKGKTGLGFVRYSESRIVACVDREHAGQSFSELTGITRNIPIVPSIEAAAQLGADTMVVGVAPTGGTPSPHLLQELLDGVKRGMSLINGLHYHFDENADFTKNLGFGQRIIEVRREPCGLRVGSGRAAKLACRRVLAIGTDMYAGKMTACLELDKAAREKGLRSAFVGTGQTGIFIAGYGIPLDAIRVDFASGAVESAVVEAAENADIVWVEGQGSLLHPGSTATLPLLRGTQPTHLILIHRAADAGLLDHPGIMVPPLSVVIRLYEELASAGGVFGYPKVAGILLNTRGLCNQEAKEFIRRTEKETSLPCTDAVRYGAGEILESLIQ